MSEQTETMLAELIRYNSWANRQVIEACQRLSEEQLDAQIPGAYGSIRETLAHIIRAEAGYVRLLTGNRPQPAFDWAGQFDLSELASFATQVGRELADAAEQVSLTKRITDEWQGEPLLYNALLVFIQVINHGIEHRTNITTILNQQEQAPPGVDGWSYLLAHRPRFAPR